MDANTVTTVLGAALMVLPVIKRQVRERRQVADAATHKEFMGWLAVLRQAGVDQRRDPEVVEMLRRYAVLIPSNLGVDKPVDFG